MTDNANKPGDQKSDGLQRHTDKAGENLAKGTPEVNAGNLRTAQNANPNRTDTVSPDGKSRFTLTDSGKPTEKQAQAAQEKAYKDAGFGDPHKPIGKPSEPGIDAEKISEQAAHALNKIMDSGKNAMNEGGKLWQGAHNGMHEFVDETGQSLSIAEEYYGNALFGKVNLGADIKEFAGAVSGGVSQSLGTAGDYYFRQVPKGEANLGEDVATASKAASDHWNSLDTEQKGHFIGKEIVPLLVPGAVGKVAKEIQGANLVGKAGEAITSFASADKFAELDQKMAQLQGHIQKLQELAKPLQPAYAAVSDGPARRPSLSEAAKKGDNYLAMSKSDEGESLPKRAGEGGERESMPEKKLVSEAFETQLLKATENLEPQLKAYLSDHNIEVKPIRRITDKFPDRPPNTMGGYSRSENCIYVAEEVFHKAEWIKNFDVDFALRHEIGHAYSATKLGHIGLDVSASDRFQLAFRADTKQVPASVMKTLGFDVSSYEGIEYAREEVFADTFGHASGCQTKNPYSILIRENFRNCLALMKRGPLQ